jgi:hypothetical protein
MGFWDRPIIYIQVYPDHLMARALGGERSIRRDCHALDNRRGPVKDFSPIRLLLKEMVRELAPGFSLRRPTALMHFIPEHYTPSQEELEQFKRTAERAGVSFCWMSKWETPHTDKELTDFFGAL